MVTCTEGKWNKQVACEPVDCGVPDQHHVYAASFSCLKGTTFGSTCSFQCRHPAQLKGIEGPSALLGPASCVGNPEAASRPSPGSPTLSRAGWGLSAPLTSLHQCSLWKLPGCAAEEKVEWG